MPNLVASVIRSRDPRVANQRDSSASLAHPEQGGGVAFFAHIGGFVFGAATVKLFQKRRPLSPAY